MRTKVEIGDFEITIEEDEDGVITVSAEKDGETVEDFTLGNSDDEDGDDIDSDEDEDGDGDDENLKPFGGEDVEVEEEEVETSEGLRIFGEKKIEKIVESKDDELKDFDSFI